MFRLVCVLTLASVALGLKVKKEVVPVEVIGHIDQEGDENDVSEETAKVFANFDKDFDLNLSFNEYNDFEKNELGEEELTTEAEFRELMSFANPDLEHGPLALSMKEYQTLVNEGKLIGSKIVPSEESLKTERKEWLNARQWRHDGEGRGEALESLVKEETTAAILEHGDKMVDEIFTTYDADKDGWLQLKEFNTLQEATEGPQGHYNSDQFRELLEQADPERDQEALSFDVLKNMYLNPDYSEEFQTELPYDYEKLVRNGHIEATAVPQELAEKFKANIAKPKEEEKKEEQKKEEEKMENKEEDKIEEKEEKKEEKKVEKQSQSSFISQLVTEKMF